MKFRTIVFLFIIIILIAGAVTKPGIDDFKEFYAKQRIQSPPVIEYTNGIAYSIFSVTSYGVTTDGAKQIAVPAAKAKYLGLFGRFWKID